MASAIQVYVRSTNVSGDISAWAVISTLFRVQIYSSLMTFDNTTPWLLIDAGLFYAQDMGWTSEMVDDALIGLAATPVTNCTIKLEGTNSARTSASDAALATLETAGCSVTVNEL